MRTDGGVDWQTDRRTWRN